MIGTSSLEYAWVVSWALILHCIGPVCLAYCVCILFLPLDLQLPWYARYWVFAEAAFYILTCLYQKYHLERPALHPSPNSREERRTLFDRCLDSTHDHAQYFSKWFLDVHISAIKRENVKEFFRWAFLNTGVIDPSYEDELDGYVDKVETRMGNRFQEGKTDAKCLRLTLDKVNALHRSLTWYMCILVVDVLTHMYLLFHGFQFYRASSRHSIQILPPRPHIFLTSYRSPSKDISYWYQPHTCRNELPIVFLHGIGVGLYPYMEFLRELNQGRKEEDGNIGIIAVEILSISSRLTSPINHKEEMCRQLRSIIDRHGIDRFVLVSHSYGSVISTHLLKTPETARKISSVILVDPITILLNQPDVAYNFTFRRPRFANEWLLWYFGSKDMGVAHTLARTFFWSENVLWKEDMLDHRCSIFLGEKDSIINSSKVFTYLQAGVERSPTCEDAVWVGPQPIKAQSSLNVVWCPGLDHGQIFDISSWRARLRSEILREVKLV